MKDIKLKYFEKIYYKIIVDLILVLQKYNFISSNINIKYIETNLIKNIDYLNYNSLSSFYIKSTEINQSNTICNLGLVYFLNNLILETDIKNIKLIYQLNNISTNQYSIQKKYNIEHEYSLDKKVIETQYNKIDSLIRQYIKLYNYINNIKNLTSGLSYSPCYSLKGYSIDGTTKYNLDIFLKYNLYDIQLNTVNNKTDLDTIKKIIL